MTTTIRFLENEASLRRYQSDESSAFEGTAEGAFLPSSISELREVMGIASHTRKTVTLRAAGTSITGSPVPTVGGWVLATERLRTLESVELPALDTEPTVVRGPDYSFGVLPDERLAVVPAGLRLFELSESLQRYGLCYPPDPTELSAMIGGTIATNASGARSYHYGATRSWVRGLLVAFANGTSRWVMRGDFVAAGGVLPLPEESGETTLDIPEDYPFQAGKNAAGLYLRSTMDLVDLFVGSEGILGVVAAALVALAPRPQRLLQTAAFFPTETEAFVCADLLRRDGTALSIEYLDNTALEFMRQEYPDLPQGGRSCVLFEVATTVSQSGTPYPPASEVRHWVDLLSRGGCTENWTVATEDVAAMKAFRHSLPEGVNRWVAAHRGKLGTDLAVSRESFPRLCEAYDDARKPGVRTVLFGHLGQYHLHLNFLAATEDELHEARRRYLGLARCAVQLGGTISAEHGVGKKKLSDEAGTLRPYLYFMHGPSGIEAIQRVKRLLDPYWLLNPETMVPRS